MSVAVELAPRPAFDRRPSLTLTNTTSGDDAATPPDSPVDAEIAISRCNSATGEQEEKEPEVAYEVPKVLEARPAFVLPPGAQEARLQADGRRTLGGLSVSKSMGSMRPKGNGAGEPIQSSKASPRPQPEASRPKPTKSNSFSAFFRKLVGSSSSTSAAKPKTRPPPVTAQPVKAPPVTKSNSTVHKPVLAIDTAMTPRPVSPAQEIEESAAVGPLADVPASSQQSVVRPADIPLPLSPTPYTIPLPPSPIMETNASTLQGTSRSVSMNVAEIERGDCEEEDEVPPLSGIGSEDSAALSPLPMTPATPVVIRDRTVSPSSTSASRSPPQEFGGQGKVSRSPSGWRSSVSSSLPLRKASRSAGPPPSSYDAYEAQQRRLAAHRRSCEPTMHTRATLAAETRGVMDKEQEEMMDRFFCS